MQVSPPAVTEMMKKCWQNFWSKIKAVPADWFGAKAGSDLPQSTGWLKSFCPACISATQQYEISRKPKS